LLRAKNNSAKPCKTIAESGIAFGVPLVMIRTHKKELQLWQSGRSQPLQAAGMCRAGQGMGQY